MNKAQKNTVLLHVRYGKKMPNETVELDEADAKRLIDGGFATEVEVEEEVDAGDNTDAGNNDNANTDENSGNDNVDAGNDDADAEAIRVSNAEIIAGLEDIDAEDKPYLLEQLGDFKLELKKDGTLYKASQEKVDAILPEGDE